MKIQTLYDLLEAAQDFCDVFENVATPAQLITRLERLKRLDVEGILEDLESLRSATSNALEENLELGGALGGDDSPEDLQKQLDEISDSLLANEGLLPGDDQADGNQTPDTPGGEPGVSGEKSDTPTG